MKENINVNDFVKILSDICTTIEREKDYLSELDRAIGDGDHGVTMSIGWTAVKEKLNSINISKNAQISQKWPISVIHFLAALW